MSFSNLRLLYFYFKILPLLRKQVLTIILFQLIPPECKSGEETGAAEPAELSPREEAEEWSESEELLLENENENENSSEQERELDFRAYLSKLATPQSLHALMLVVSEFASNPPDATRSALQLLQMVAEPSGPSGASGTAQSSHSAQGSSTDSNARLLYQLRLFRTFERLLDNQLYCALPRFRVCLHFSFHKFTFVYTRKFAIDLLDFLRNFMISSYLYCSSFSLHLYLS